jgi:hypothetical protein
MKVPKRPPTEYEMQNAPRLNTEPAPAPPKVSFNQLLVVQYLQDKLGVPSLTYEHKTKHFPVSFFAPQSAINYELCNVRSLNLTFTFSGVLPTSTGTFIPLKQCSSFKKEQTDELDKYEKVTFWNCCCRQYDNRSKYNVNGSFSIMNDHVAYKDADKDMQELQQSLGVLRHASLFFKANTSEEKDQFALKTQTIINAQDESEVRYHYNNIDFIRMTYRIHGHPLFGPFLDKPKEECCAAEVYARENNTIPSPQDNNLWNGIVRIPADVCKKAGLPLYDANVILQREKERLSKFETTEKVELDENVIAHQALLPDHEQSRCWYAMDTQHVLAWSLDTSNAQRVSMGIECLHVERVIGKQRIRVCYLITDASLRQLIWDYNCVFANKVDIRSNVKDTVGFYLAPITGKDESVEVNLKFEVELKYVGWLDPNPNQAIAPKIPMTFPPFVAFQRSPFEKIK